MASDGCLWHPKRVTPFKRVASPKGLASEADGITWRWHPMAVDGIRREQHLQKEAYGEDDAPWGWHLMAWSGIQRDGIQGRCHPMEVASDTWGWHPKGVAPPKSGISKEAASRAYCLLLGLGAASYSCPGPCCVVLGTGPHHLQHFCLPSGCLVALVNIHDPHYPLSLLAPTLRLKITFQGGMGCARAGERLITTPGAGSLGSQLSHPGSRRLGWNTVKEGDDAGSFRSCGL